MQFEYEYICGVREGGSVCHYAGKANLLGSTIDAKAKRICDRAFDYCAWYARGPVALREVSMNRC